MSNFDLQCLKGARKLISNYHGFWDEICKSAQPLFKYAKDCGFPDIIEEQYKKAESLLELFRRNQLGRFDPFRIAGFVAYENNFSDSLAAIIDPNGSHGLGITPLKRILGKLPTWANDKAQSILRLLGSSGIIIRVRREEWRKSCRPDIVIRSNDFIIYIENKIRGGIETECSGEYQTSRQYEDLQRRAEKLNIPWLGIYLTPEGKSPNCRDFVPLSTSELISAILESLNDVECCESRSIIRAFLDFYSWGN